MNTQTPGGHTAAIHDIFTYLCDRALNRPPRPWRWQIRDHHRLHFLRRLAHDAGLIDPATAGPGPLAADWLRQPPAGQLTILAEAWINQSDTASRQECFDRLLSLPSGGTITPANLTNRSSLARQRNLWLPLYWLGYLTSSAQSPVSPLLKRVAIPDQPDPMVPWQIEGTTIIVPYPCQWSDLWELEQLAALVDIGPPRCYTANPASVRASQDLINLLERTTGEPIPIALWETLSPSPPGVVAQAGVLLTFTDPAVLAELRGRNPWRGRFVNTLSPNRVWVSTAQAPLILRALRHRGLTVDGDLRPNHPLAAGSASNLTPLHLLLAAHVMQSLARDLNLPAPLDEATLSTLAAGLPASQQRRLERATQLQLVQIRQRLPEPRAVAGPQPSLTIQETILAAIANGHALQLHYQPPIPRPLITRPVIPLRLEPLGPHTYLIAHCLYRNASRTFRLDRIVKAEVNSHDPSDRITPADY
jgi:hypothetical protein